MTLIFVPFQWLIKYAFEILYSLFFGQFHSLTVTFVGGGVQPESGINGGRI